MLKKNEIKHIISDVEFVECPYCKRDGMKGNKSENKFQVLKSMHLKLHNKTFDDLFKEFPGWPTQTSNIKNKNKERGIIGGENSKKTCHILKKRYCMYCGKEDEVPNNYPNLFACKQCLDKGLEDPDGRVDDKANDERDKTNKKKYGNNYTKIFSSMSSNAQRKKYGGIGFQVESISNKARNTTNDKYGVMHIMQSEEGKNKQRQSIFEHYGVLNPMECPQISQKVSKRLKNKESKLKGRNYIDIHGYEKSQLLIEQKRQLNIKKFLPDLKLLLKQHSVELLDSEYLGAHTKHNFKCTLCGHEYQQIWNAIQQNYLCPKCSPRMQGFSIGEKQLVEFIKSLNLGYTIIERDKKTIAPKELDINIPDLKIAFEYNGLYFHKYNKNLRNSKYHLEKTDMCFSKGIRLIHIFEDEWVLKQQIVKERIKHILGISKNKKINGRDCIIKEIESNIKNKFLNEYHIQGSDNSTIKLGAFYNDELVGVMTFSYGNPAKGSQKIEGVWELSRFCCNYNYHIPGVAGKLLEYFKRNYNWIQIYTYADRRWSLGNMYLALGFETNGKTRVNYWYVKQSAPKRIYRYSLRKQPDEPKDIPEWKLREEQGYYRVFDCGSLKFILENDKIRQPTI